MAKFKGKIVFEVNFKDMHIPLFAIDNIVQKVALHKCSQQIQFWHEMSFNKDKKHLYQKNIFVGTIIKKIELDN
tara:strand:- start:2985 stop:3206 length:222 start_codon:yes stop_codon:yes gene_type:complete